MSWQGNLWFSSSLFGVRTQSCVDCSTPFGIVISPSMDTGSHGRCSGRLLPACTWSLDPVWYPWETSAWSPLSDLFRCNSATDSRSILSFLGNFRCRFRTQNVIAIMKKSATLTDIAIIAMTGKTTLLVTWGTPLSVSGQVSFEREELVLLQQTRSFKSRSSYESEKQNEALVFCQVGCNFLPCTGQTEIDGYTRVTLDMHSRLCLDTV